MFFFKNVIYNEIEQFDLNHSLNHQNIRQISNSLIQLSN